jgi:phosphomannomutase
VSAEAAPLDRAPLDPGLVREVTEWIREDPDAATREELTALLAARDAATLHERFDHPLTFGTAGLRGVVGGGPGAMNRLVVRRTAAGVADWVAHKGAGAPAAGVVVGRDARHGSAAFARDTVEVLRAAGVAALLLDHPLPTPLTAFAVRHLGAAAGVVVTASHNPARDNGYKVYDQDGSQIVPPADAAIEAASRHLAAHPGAAAAVPGELTVLDEATLVEAYVAAIGADLETSGDPTRALRVAYTPLHGVGGAVVPGLLESAGVDVEVVAAQAAPDPDFPTVAFPNPEEPGSMDLVLALGTSIGADLVVANDPDADRCCVAVPVAGGWRLLSGDELGAILGEDRCARTSGSDRLVATSIVSSSLLSRIAARHDVAFAETLTGFKWLGRVGAAAGRRLVFAYEEALGYAVSGAVADKDGMSAALAVCDLAARCAAGSRTLLDELDALYATHGVHLTRQLSFRREGPDGAAEIAATVAALVTDPPTTLGGLGVTSVEDLSVGQGGLPPTEGVRLRAADAVRVVVRPSGTEPKLKAYVEVVDAPAGAQGLAASRAVMAALLERCASDVAARCAPVSSSPSSRP